MASTQGWTVRRCSWPLPRFRWARQTLTVVTERPLSEALALTVRTLAILGGVIVVALLAAGALGLLAVRQIVRPIQSLSTVAQAIQAGDLSQQAAVVRHDEIGDLAGAFNSMTAQLQTTLEDLERRRAAEQEQREYLQATSRSTWATWPRWAAATWRRG